ncbi:MAG TPA: methylmalonyl-CoA mutase family protein [Acidobacteriota bacterium]|nr:methylmalonyl-CoA mutase family protein [Acidobacteriota bacterium]
MVPAPPKDSAKIPSESSKKAVYKPDDTAADDYAQRLNDPGKYPFTRGIYPTMYRGRLWTMRQYAGYASAEESNRRYRYLLSQGTTGLSVAFDLPTQIGIDSTHELAEGEVGKVGVAIDSLEDMRRLFDGIPLERVSTSMTINATASILLALYLAVADEQGVPWEQLRGTIQNDILKEYIARGTYIYPPQPSLRIITDIFAFCHQQVPRWNTISISGYHIREAGSTAAQELAFTLADGETYVEAAIAEGLSVDDFAPRISFFFNAHNDFFEEVAKYRAARRMWATLMKERFKAENPKSWMLRFHTQTAGSTLTAQQPDTNVVRVALQALSAVLGGTQSLHTNSKDEALGLPTDSAARLALRTQQVIAHESGVAETADPLGGSWLVESLTSRLEDEAQAYMQRIREMGGMLRAIESGYVQREIQKAAYDYQRGLEEKSRIVVGVNDFKEGAETAIEALKIDPEVELRQRARLQSLKDKRDNDRTQKALEAVRKAAREDSNLMPPILEAVKALASVGEIADAMRDVFGEYQETVVF